MSEISEWYRKFFPKGASKNDPACEEAERYWLHFLKKSQANRLVIRDMRILGVNLCAIQKNVAHPTHLVLSSDNGELDGVILHYDRPFYPLRTLYDRPLAAKVGTTVITPEDFISQFKVALDDNGLVVGSRFYSNIEEVSRIIDDSKVR